jgi:hypothetical protein
MEARITSSTDLADRVYAEARWLWPGLARGQFDDAGRAAARSGLFFPGYAGRDLRTGVLRQLEELYGRPPLWRRVFARVLTRGAK